MAFRDLHLIGEMFGELDGYESGWQWLSERRILALGRVPHALLGQSLGDPITQADIDNVRRRWDGRFNAPSGDSAFTVARIDIRILLHWIDQLTAPAEKNGGE